MSYSFSKNSIKHMSGVHPDLIKLANRAIEISFIDFGVPYSGGIRTDEQQNSLFKAGASKADGYIRKSKHQSGLALDFFAYVDGRASWKKDYLTIIAAAFMQAAIELDIKIVWGGWWTSFPDYPHIQLA